MPLSSGVVYVVGNTSSVDFPVKNEFQGPHAGTNDAFVAKLDLNSSNAEQSCDLTPNPIVHNDCDDLLSSTYLGGSNFDAGLGIARNGSNSVYVTGQTCSSDFPKTGTAFDTSANGACDAFLTSLFFPFVGSILLTYSTFLGGTAWDLGRGVFPSPAPLSGVLITGETASTDFPVKGPAQDQHGGGQLDVFVTRILTNSNNTNDNCSISGLDYNDCDDLLWSTFLGGGDYDFGHSVAADPSGTAYVTGQTCSADFPLEQPLPQDAGQDINVGTGCDAFVTKFTPNGSALAYSTYLGGSSSDSGNGIFVDLLGNAYIAGATSSGNFPQESPLQAAGGAEDAFVAKITVPCVDGGGAYAYTVPNVIDTANDCLVGAIPAMFATGQAVSPDDALYYTTDFQTVSFVDPVTSQVDDLMPNGVVTFQGAAVSPDGTRLYVSDHSDSAPSFVHVFNTHTKQFVESIPFGANDASNSVGGSGVAVHPDGTKLYVVSYHSDDQLFVIDLATKQSTPIHLDNVDNGSLWGIAVTPDGKWVYIATGFQNDTVSIVDATTDTWVENLTVKGATYVAITPEKVSNFGYLVYVTAENSQDLTVIDTDTQAIVHIEPGAGGGSIEVTPDGTKLYVTAGFVKVIDVDTNQWVNTVLGPTTFSVLGSFMGPQDRDDDGIIDQVDTDQNTFSDDFTDGSSSGSIIDRADQKVTVWDAFQNGLYVNARGGTQTAHVQACGQDVFLDQNDAVKFVCASLTIEVFQGPAEIGLWADTFAVVPTGGVVRVSEPSPEEFVLENLGSVTVTVIDDLGNVLASVEAGDSLNNLAPIITSINVSPTPVDEGSPTTITALFTDPSSPDTHTATIDWGDGSALQNLGTVTSPFSATHAYGDNDTYTVTVTVTDDDNDSDSAQATVTVLNLDPTLVLDTSGSITFPSGNTAFTGRKDVEQQHHAEATDPGSDDLTFDWDFGVSTSSTTVFNNGASADPFPSPDGTFPFGASDTALVTFVAPGIYTVAVTVTDDDGGSDSDNQSLDKVVVDDCDCTKSQGFWKHQFSDKGDDEKIDNATLGSYLEIIRYGSSLFGVTVPLNDRGDAKSILDPTKSGTRPSKGSKSNNKGGKNGSQRGTGGNLDKKRDKALTQTLAAWLNYAKGSIAWDDLVDTNGDGTPDTQFGVLIAEVESILNDSNADKNDLERAKDLAKAVNLHDKDNLDCDTGTGSGSKTGTRTTESRTRSQTSGGGGPNPE